MFRWELLIIFPGLFQKPKLKREPNYLLPSVWTKISYYDFNFAEVLATICSLTPTRKNFSVYLVHFFYQQSLTLFRSSFGAKYSKCLDRTNNLCKSDSIEGLRKNWISYPGKKITTREVQNNLHICSYHYTNKAS